MLRTFFPRRSRPRTVVHAGSLLLRRKGGAGALRRYLRVPRRREMFLVHPDSEPLREVAEQAGVADITVPGPVREEDDSVAELALALGARRLDFSIDEPGVAGPDGEPLREVTVREAERMAMDPGVRPRIRAKLRAGVAAVKLGVARVRIGSPAALTLGRATALVPDLMVPNRASGGPTPWADRAGESWPPVAEPVAATGGRRQRAATGA